jgi:cephalosporin-C deacetylase-like acetyl esterase
LEKLAMQLSRRGFFEHAGLLAASPLLWRFTPWGRAQSYAQDYPDMLLAWLADQLNAFAAKWDAERADIHTSGDIETRNRFVRSRFVEMIHGLPPRTPLNPKVVRVTEMHGYRIENVLFESRPDFWVTGNLYLPSGNGPFPAIISPCGHYALARMQPNYQAVYLNLVKNGFVVFAYDPIGQGERRHYWDPCGAPSEITDPVYEHSMPGQLLLLMRQDLTHYRIWDGMRAIDFLLTRPEVDGSRIGCAGHSGGGTMTMFISALDERVRCAVISEGGTGHRWPVRIHPGDRVGPSDVEQNLFPAAVYGIDICDLHVAIAPRPLLAMIEEYSPHFDAAAAHIRQRYVQLGAAECFATAEANDPHAYTVKLRLATTDWFSRWFYGRPGPASEPDLDLQKPEALYATPHGSIREAGQGETIFSLIKERAAVLPPPHDVPADADSLTAYRSQVSGQIRSLLRLGQEQRRAFPEVRQLGITPRKGYSVEKIEFLSEPGVYIPAWVFLPGRRTSDRVILFASEAGKEEDGMEFGCLEGLAHAGRVVISVDVRGVGETTPPHCQDLDGNRFSHLFSVETAAAYMAWYMDLCLLGMRVYDVVRSVDYSLSRTDVDRSGVDAIGKGAGALWVLYASALDGRIRAAVAERGLISYASLTRVDRYLHSAGIFVRDVLTCFDLPQVAAAVADRRLSLLSPVGPMKEVDVPMAQREYEFTRQVYRGAGAEERFAISGADVKSYAADEYLRLLR